MKDKLIFRNNVSFVIILSKINSYKYSNFNEIKIILFHRVTFDRQADQGAGFVSHIRLNHYMWNYLFYTAYL
jgi:hypothetical protein